METPLLIFTVFSFSVKLPFEWEYMGHFYDSIKNRYFKKTKKARHDMKLCSKYHQGSTHELEH